MTILDRIANRLDRRILRLHGRTIHPDDIDHHRKLVCHAHDEPQPWPCDDWFAALARLKARRHMPSGHTGGDDD